MQIGFFFDQTRCTGCSACAVACKDWNDVPAGPENWMRVRTTESGRYPAPFVSHMISPCWHCAEPLCAASCPAGAIAKSAADGIVLVDPERCLGNAACDERCRKACPYGAPQFGPEPGARMRKCTLCVERVRGGRLPECVEACPARALAAGPLAELEARYGANREAPGFHYSRRARPAVVIKPKKRA